MFIRIYNANPAEGFSSLDSGFSFFSCFSFDSDFGFSGISSFIVASTSSFSDLGFSFSASCFSSDFSSAVFSISFSASTLSSGSLFSSSFSFSFSFFRFLYIVFCFEMKNCLFSLVSYDFLRCFYIFFHYISFFQNNQYKKQS